MSHDTHQESKNQELIWKLWLIEGYFSMVCSRPVYGIVAAGGHSFMAISVIRTVAITRLPSKTHSVSRGTFVNDVNSLFIFWNFRYSVENNCSSIFSVHGIFLNSPTIQNLKYLWMTHNLLKKVAFNDPTIELSSVYLLPQVQFEFCFLIIIIRIGKLMAISKRSVWYAIDVFSTIQIHLS